MPPTHSLSHHSRTPPLPRPRPPPSEEIAFTTNIPCNPLLMSNDRSFLLEDVEEVLNLQDPIVRQVRAVHSVLRLVLPEHCPQRLRTDCPRHLWVMGAAELTQGWHNVLLADFEGDARAIGELFHDLVVFGHYSFVNLQKFLHGDGSTSADGRSSQNI